jgi:hypothetical protein
LFESIDLLVSSLLVEVIHLRCIQIESTLVLAGSSGTSTWDFNALQTALDLLVHLRDHLLKECLKLLLILSLVAFFIRFAVEHVLQELIVTLLAPKRGWLG